jgi:nitronate monooxygenase
MDPDNLPAGDKPSMDFGSGGGSESKAWRGIWGAGQGVGQVDTVLPAGEIVERLAQEREAARGRLLAA